MTKASEAAPGVESVALRDGRRVTLRRAEPGDQQLVGQFFDSLAGGSLEARRIATIHAGTARQRKQLVEPTARRAMVLAVPEGPGAPVVGIATYGYVADEGSCEVVLVVGDGWQGVGLGSALLDAAVRDARAQGFRLFHAMMLGGNMRMLRLLREKLADKVRTRVQGGLVRVDFEVV